MYKVGHPFYELPRRLREVIKKINKCGGYIRADGWYPKLSYWIGFPVSSHLSNDTFNELEEKTIISCIKRDIVPNSAKETWEISEEYKTG